MADDAVQVINHHQANLVVKERTAKSGAVTSKTAITISVDSEPIGINLDEGVVARRVAEMLAQRIREQTEQITEQVKPSTAAARRRLEKAFAAGKPDALRKFSGGRTGVTPPRAGSNQAFNHSGRLAESIVARYVEKTKEFVINYAANRWNAKDWPDMGRMQAAYQRWVAHLPVLQRMSDDLGIRRAAQETMGEIVEKNEMNAGYRAAKVKGELLVKVLQFAARAVAA